MLIDLPAIGADMQMTIVPMLGVDIGLEVPTAAPQVGDEHAPPSQPAEQGGKAARQHVTLMAMNHAGLPKLREQSRRNRIVTLCADVPWPPDHTHAKLTMAFLAFAFTKSEQPG